MRSLNPSFQKIVFFLLLIQLVNINLVYAKAKQTINIAYLTQEQIVPAQLSNLDPYIPFSYF